MARLALCIAAAAVLALLLRDRPVRTVALAIVIWAALPAVAAHRITGQDTGPLAVHPATWLVLATFGVQLILRPAPLAAAVARHRLVVLAGTVFVLGAFWTSMVNDTGGLRLLLDQVLAPMLVFLLLLGHAWGDARRVSALRVTILAVAAAQAVLTIIQSLAGRMLLYEADYETLYWFNPEKFDRWMGTTDSPLILAYLLCIAAALSIGVRSVALRLALLGLYLVGVLITQSRTGVLVVCVVILYAILRSRMVLWARALAGAVAALGAYVLLSSTLIAGFATRLADDSGSFDARQRALSFIFGNWSGYLFSGEGLTASYTVARGAGLATSIESSLLMYVVDLGWALVAVYFGAQLALLVRHGFRRSVAGVTLAATVALFLPHVSSALAWSNMSGTLLWTSLAVMVLAGRELTPPAADQASGAPASVSVATSPAVYSPAT